MVYLTRMPASQKGFTLIEILASVAIIGVLASLIALAMQPALRRARDTKRRADLTTIGRFLTQRCYLPDAGAGSYDLAALVPELLVKYPQYSQALGTVPKDPRSGTDALANYAYYVNAAGTQCALAANLEDAGVEVTLTHISAPTPAGGTGVFESAAAGPNGTLKFFQISN